MACLPRHLVERGGLQMAPGHCRGLPPASRPSTQVLDGLTKGCGDLLGPPLALAGTPADGDRAGAFEQAIGPGPARLGEPGGHCCIVQSSTPCPFVLTCSPPFDVSVLDIPGRAGDQGPCAEVRVMGQHHAGRIAPSWARLQHPEDALQDLVVVGLFLPLGFWGGRRGEIRCASCPLAPKKAQKK